MVSSDQEKHLTAISHQFQIDTKVDCVAVSKMTKSSLSMEKDVLWFISMMFPCAESWKNKPFSYSHKIIKCKLSYIQVWICSWKLQTWVRKHHFLKTRIGKSYILYILGKCYVSCNVGESHLSPKFDICLTSYSSLRSIPMHKIVPAGSFTAAHLHLHTMLFPHQT